LALKKRADGRCVKSIVDPRTGKRKYFYGKNEREIDRKILAYNGEVERGKTFEEVADDWWEEARPKLSKQSIRGYQRAYNRAVEVFGSSPVKEVTPRDVNVYLKNLSLQFAQKTVATYRMVANLILNHAMLMGEIQFNPCTCVPSVKGLPKEKRTSATAEEEKKIIQNADTHFLPYFALMTGMRKGEILALTWGDIDFDRNFIFVNKSLAHDGDRPFVKETKTEAGNRIVPLLDSLKGLLLDRMKGKKPSDLVISDNGKPYTNRRFITTYSKIQEELGISCTLHQLRHSFATIAFEMGLPPKTIQEILGHRQLATTMDIYTDFRHQAIADATAILNKREVGMRSKP
jgi:integrase